VTRLALGAAAAAVLLTAVVAVVVAGDDGGSSAAPGPTAAADNRGGTAGLRAPHPCPKLDGFTCSTLRVPIDHARPAGRSLDLAVASADNTDAPRGVLLFLTGGPGQPGIPFVRKTESTLAPVLDDYRLVMLDQRGTGANKLVCPQLQRQLGVSDLFVPTSEAVRECADRVGADRRYYSTADTVADLELLRSALGVPAVSIDGVSYGTYVAERYAIAHPDRVSRLVLDSVVPHDGIEPFLTVPLHAAARVLRDVCADRQCPGDPADDLAAVVRARQDGSDILNTITIMEFVSSDYEGVPEALHAAAQGDMRALNEMIAGVRRGVQAPAAELSQGLHVSTLCADGVWPWGSLAVPVQSRADDVARAAIGLDPASVWPFDLATARGNGILATCLGWPQTAVDMPPLGALPKVPILMLGGDRDLSTPLEWMHQEAASAPGAQVVVVPDATHGVQTRATDDKGRQAVYDFLTADS
jgi:pimeloyl-ACP methyl ester carboxylesterase